MSDAVEVVDLHKQFGGVTAVDGCSFAVEENTITGLIGPNGAGKTSVFNLITGFYHADEGDVRINGESVTGLSPHEIVHRGMIRVYQETRVFPELTVLENMLAPVRSDSVLFQGSHSDASIDRAYELLEMVTIRRLADEEAGNLSYGQQRLLELAMAFMVDPDIVLLDEPTAGINPNLIEDLKSWIRSLQDGCTFLLIEHNMDVMMELADHIVVLDSGQKLAEGDPDTVQKNPHVLEAYLGEEL